MKNIIKYITLYLLTTILIFGNILFSQDQKSSLRILDINVWSGLDYIGSMKMGEYETPEIREKRYQALISQINELNPDVVGIHEANLLPNYAKRLAKDLGCIPFYHIGVGGIHIGPIGLPSNLREGDVILVKEEFSPKWIGRKQLSGGYVGKYFTFHFEDATQVIGVRINVNGNPVNIYATHWHSSLLPEKEILIKSEEIFSRGKASQMEYDSLITIIDDGIKWRISESEKTIQFIHDTAENHPVILMGDFNSTNQSEEIRLLKRNGLIDTYNYLYPDSAGFTWNPKTNINQKIHYLNDDASIIDNIFDEIYHYEKYLPKRIDCIFIGDQSLIFKGRVSINNSKVVMQKIIDGVQASDHYGIFSEIEIKE